MAQQSLENDLKHYFKEIKSLFPVYGMKEKQFLASLKSDVDEYIASNPASDYAQLISVFDEPKIIVAQYIAEADAEYLSKRIRVARVVRICATIIVIAIIVATVSIISMNYADSIKGQEHYIDREVTEFVE
jgi:hypothetical protein